MTEVPIPSTDNGGEQRGRTRGNLPFEISARNHIKPVLAFSKAEDGKDGNK